MWRRLPLFAVAVRAASAALQFKTVFAENAKFDTAFKADKLRGIVEITAHVGDQTLNYIPYYSWDNREAGKMKVWVPLAD